MQTIGPSWAQTIEYEILLRYTIISTKNIDMSFTPIPASKIWIRKAMHDRSNEQLL